MVRSTDDELSGSTKQVLWGESDTSCGDRVMPNLYQNGKINMFLYFSLIRVIDLKIIRIAQYLS